MSIMQLKKHEKNGIVSAESTQNIARRAYTKKEKENTTKNEWSEKEDDETRRSLGSFVCVFRSERFRLSCDHRY